MRPRCLIVDDQWLIAAAIEGYLEDAGWEAMVAGTEAEAIAAIDAARPAVAVIDYLLRDGPCCALASELRHRGIPFVIYSGVSADAGCAPQFVGAPWLGKPCRREDLLAAIEAATRPMAPGARGTCAGS